LFRLNVAGHTTTNTLSFIDRPADYRLQAGESIEFRTFLVGVHADPTSFDVLYDWKWLTNYNGSVGGVAVRRNEDPVSGGTAGWEVPKMTVGIAALCESGKYMVLAADAMVSNGLYEFDVPSRTKIRKLSNTCFCIGAGDASASSELVTRVTQQVHRQSPTVAEVVGVATRCYEELRNREICELFLLSRGMSDAKTFRDNESSLLEDVWSHIEQEIDEYRLGNRECAPELGALIVLVGGIDGDQAHLHHIHHRRLALRHDVPRTAHGGSRIHRDDVAGDEVIEEHLDRGEMLFHRGIREGSPILGVHLYIGATLFDV
jgi:hypothetical protein